MFASKQSVTAC